MNVGLVAHDGKKNLMQNLCIAYQDILKKHKLYATSTTGQMIEDVANFKISNNEIDLLIFLQDPANKKRTPDFYNVLNLCDQYNIPCATNLPTAEVLILALDRGDLDWRNMYK